MNFCCKVLFTHVFFVTKYQFTVFFSVWTPQNKHFTYVWEVLGHKNLLSGKVLLFLPLGSPPPSNEVVAPERSLAESTNEAKPTSPSSGIDKGILLLFSLCAKQALVYMFKNPSYGRH